LDKSVLYIGSLAAWSNSNRRYKALKNICNDTDVINTDPYLLPKLISGFQTHLNIGPGVFLLNRVVRKKAGEKKYDIIWVDNKPFLSKKTLLYINARQPFARIISLLTDDPFGRFTKSWPLLKRTAPFYSIFFVQREVNINELKNIGAQNVELCYRSFDPAYNKPMDLNSADLKKYHTPVGFVGTYETERASYISFLIENGVPVSVTGNDWPEKEYWEIIKPFYQGPSVYGEEYIKTVNGMDIALHFLRHGNRDEQDSRTFEIPACRVFMLAERSDLHSRLFIENEEAVFFSTKEELLKKVKVYQSAKEERKRIAKNGYEKCFSAGYDHESRIKKVLETVSELRTN
jgi:hypothetical protein